MAVVIQAIVKMHFFFRKSSLLTGIDQTKCIIVVTQYGSTKIDCKFQNPRSMGSCARAWQNKSYSENALFL